MPRLLSSSWRSPLSSPKAEVLHDDGAVVVLNKPANVSLLRDRSGAPCLWDALPELIGGKPYQVHRLDKGTSGVLLLARSPRAQQSLSAAFRDRVVRKYYLAWVVGELRSGGTINLPLKRGRKSRYRVAGQRGAITRTAAGWQLSGEQSSDGLDSVTRIRPLRAAGDRTLIMAQPRTGRTHQLRVHLAWIGFPILGDHLYGRPDNPAQQAPRLQLHCHRLVVPGWGSFAARWAGSGWLKP